MMVVTSAPDDVGKYKVVPDSVTVKGVEFIRDNVVVVVEHKVSRTKSEERADLALFTPAERLRLR